MTVNYSEIADTLQSMPVDRKVYNERDFKILMRKKGLEFKFDIDRVDEGTRQVWGNRAVEIIVLKSDDNSYQEL